MNTFSCHDFCLPLSLAYGNKELHVHSWKKWIICLHGLCIMQVFYCVYYLYILLNGFCASWGIAFSANLLIFSCGSTFDQIQWWKLCAKAEVFKAYRSDGQHNLDTTLHLLSYHGFLTLHKILRLFMSQFWKPWQCHFRNNFIRWMNEISVKLNFKPNVSYHIL